jgi:hypothetical protein
MTEDHSSNTIGAPPPPAPPPPPSSILFTYKPDQIQLEIDKRADLNSDNVDEQEKAKAALAGWFPIDYAKAILKAAQQGNIWVGIGKRGNEIVERWQAGQEMHPWLPERITVGDFSLDAKDAAPIAQDTLYNEVRKMPELGSLSADKIQSITVKPAWRRPAEPKTAIGDGEKLSEGTAYQLGAVKADEWTSLVTAMVSQFKEILPLGPAYTQYLAGVAQSECGPRAAFICGGLCGAWSIVEVQYCEDSKTQKNLKVLIPVGLLKPESAGGHNPALKVPFNETEGVYTPGPDFRFIGVKGGGSAQDHRSRVAWLNRACKKELKPREKFFENWGQDKFDTPINNFKLCDTTAWICAADSDARIREARKLAPNIVGRESLAVFADDGIHLLENEKQIGAWCAKNKLLDRLFQPPPWSSDAKWLDEKIARVWSGNRWTPTTRNWPGGKQALEDEVLVPKGSPPIPSASGITDRLASVLGSKGKGIGDSNEADWDKIIVQKSIEDFRKLKEAGQIGFINDLWNILTTAYPFDKPVRQMYEPTASDNSDLQETGKQYRPLPTAWQPDGFSKAKYESSYGRLLSEGGKWRELGVGFRVEGESAKLQETLKRLEKNGMTQWRLDKHLMAKTSGFYIEGTLFDGDIPGNLDRARFWNGNHDILNQTAVCVSRNLFGATAFPERWSKGDFILFAVDCSNLQGCDTEQKQIDIFQKYKGDQKYKDERKRAEIMRWWRPGEKAFKEIKWENIIGWVPFTKEGQPPGTGWKFKIDAGANWTINQAWKVTASLYVKKMAYIDNELGTWRGEHIVPYDFDFVAYP